MILALDSYYKEDICNTSLVLFANVESQIPIYTDTIFTKVKSKYIPGEFYKRELPGIKKILFKSKYFFLLGVWTYYISGIGPL